jgi:hypothetical protein
MPAYLEASGGMWIRPYPDDGRGWQPVGATADEVDELLEGRDPDPYEQAARVGQRAGRRRDGP